MRMALTNRSTMKMIKAIGRHGLSRWDQLLRVGDRAPVAAPALLPLLLLPLPVNDSDRMVVRLGTSQLLAALRAAAEAVIGSMSQGRLTTQRLMMAMTMKRRRERRRTER